MEEWLQELKRLLLSDIQPLGQQMDAPVRFDTDPVISSADIVSWEIRFRQLAERIQFRFAADGGPWMLSAWRLYELLALLALGAGGHTRAELLHLLDHSEERLAELAKGFHLLDQMAEQRAYADGLPMRPMMWYHQDMKWERDFETVMRTFFSMRTEALNFDDPGVLLQVNARLHTWMAPASPEDVARFPGWLLPVMQCDLKLKWKHPFSVDNTISYQFMARPGVKTPALMMQQLLFLPVAEGNDYLGIDLALEKDSLRLRVIMPLDEGQIEIPKGAIWQEEWPLQKCRIGFPKMEWRQTRDLRPYLEQLGIESLFEPLTADLSHLTDQQISLDAWPDHQALCVH
ncbi:MAG: serpin family protein, partial [Bacteroidota bacterium]